MIICTRYNSDLPPNASLTNVAPKLLQNKSVDTSVEVDDDVDSTITIVSFRFALVIDPRGLDLRNKDLGCN